MKYLYVLSFNLFISLIIEFRALHILITLSLDILFLLCNKIKLLLFFLKSFIISKELSFESSNAMIILNSLNNFPMEKND